MSVTGRGAKAPHSIAVELIGGAERAAIACEMKGHRYHVWAILDRHDASVFEAEDAVYKNCARGLVRGDKGYFPTRTLDGTTGQGKLVRDALLAAAPELISKARADFHAARLQLAAQSEAQVKAARVRENAQVLLALVMGFEAAMRTPASAEREQTLMAQAEAARTVMQGLDA